MNTQKRQGDILVAMLKKRGMTTLELLQAGVSVCPWKRVRECIPPGWMLDKTGKRGRLTVYRVVRVDATKKREVCHA